MAKAKLTINKAQAKALGLLTANTKSKFPIISDPKSGITLKETIPGKYITVRDGADISNLIRFQKMKCFSVVEGEILPPPEIESIAITGEDEDKILITFSEKIKNQELSLGTDFLLTIDGIDIENEDLVIDENLAYTQSIVLDLANIEETLTDDNIALSLTKAGAAKIYNKFNACAKPTAENEDLEINRDPEVPALIELLCDPSVIRLDQTLDVNATINVIVKNQYGEVMAGEENNVVLELAEGNDPGVSFDLVDPRIIILSPEVAMDRFQILASHEDIEGEPVSLMVDIEEAAIPTSVVVTTDPETIQLSTDSTVTAAVSVAVFNQYDEEMLEEGENISLDFAEGTDEDIVFDGDNRTIIFPLAADIAEGESILTVEITAVHNLYAECTGSGGIFVKHPSVATTIELTADPASVTLNDIGGGPVLSTISAVVLDQYGEEIEEEVLLSVDNEPIAGVAIDGLNVSFTPDCIAASVTINGTAGDATDSVIIEINPYIA